MMTYPLASGEGRTDVAERNRDFGVVLDVFLVVVFREPPALAAVAGFFVGDGVLAALDGPPVFFFTGFFVTLAAGFLVVLDFLAVEVFFCDFFGARAAPVVVRVFFLVTFFLAIATILDTPPRVSS